jgi:LuxR family maltose regulon positive regulatory protein
MAPSPILSTKINIPTYYHRLVLRFRLFKRLNRGMHSKLSLVCAPAGSGKSTLVSSWLLRQETRTVWISLDENDDDWTRFFLYMITALERSESGTGTASLELLNSEKPLSYEELMTNIIEDLSMAQRDCILVFDDFHLIRSRQVHTALTFLIDNLPPKIHLVILARTEPSLPIAKLRAQRQLTQITAGDMQFNLAEAEEFLTHVMNLNLTQKEISALTERTEGWVVGLQLAALSIRDGRKSSEFINNLSGKDRHIADYLVDEVLARQTEEVQSFLLKTSVLERMCGGLCNSMLAISNSEAILETIERLNLFIIPLDNAREWYRYHHLFGELLLARLERQHPDAFIPLNRRACRWHKKQDLLEEAVRYAFKAKDYKEAALIVEQIGHATYWANRSDTLRKWLKDLPDKIVRDNFDFQILQAYVQINVGKVHEADRTLESLEANMERFAEEGVEELSILRGKLLSAFSSVRYHRQMDWREVCRVAGKSLALLPSNYTYERCVDYFHGGGAMVMTGELEEAEPYLRCARDMSDSVKNPFAKLLTLSNLGMLSLVRGELRKAYDIFRETHEFGLQCRANQEATYSNAVVGTALLLYEWNRLAESRTFLDEALEITEKYDFFDRILAVYETDIQYHCTTGDVEAAEKTLERGRRILKDNGPTPIALRRSKALEAFVALQKGALDEAVAWANGFSRSFSDQVCFELETELLVLCKIWIAAGSPGKAVALLQKLHSLARQQNRMRSVIRIMILLSMACFSLREEDRGLKHLRISLQLARPEGYIRSFVDEGEPLGIRLAGLIDRNGDSMGETGLGEYVLNLQDAFSGTGRRPEPAKKVTASIESEGISPLTPRECEVLAMLDRGLTYAEISKQMAISENTLKYHVKNIYGKLQVNKRIKAVATAKKLGFL